MTTLDDDALAEVQRFQDAETRNESQMIAVLVKEAIAVRRSREDAMERASAGRKTK
jgi:hypothetical protein